MRENKIRTIQFAILLVAVVYLIKLLFIQVLNSDYQTKAFTNAIKRVTVYPHRGTIKDRKDRILVSNTPVFDIIYTPRKTKIDDTLAFCEVFGLTKSEFIAKINEIKYEIDKKTGQIVIDKKTGKKKMKDTYSSFKPNVFMGQLTAQEFALIQDRLVDYPGFEVQARSVRMYPHKSMANALGYIGEIGKEKLDKLAEQGNFTYKPGDYIGRSGLEQKYEDFLKGQRGTKFIMTDVHGLERGSFGDGKYDTLSVAGKDLFCSVDLELQQYAEYLIAGKTGSIVAIEPKTGEILAFVSSPSYDPNILRGKEMKKNYAALLKDPSKPLFVRPLNASYPPGSTFKLVNALIALNEGLIDTSTVFPCNRSVVNCHGSHSSANVFESIRVSCNPYYVAVFKKLLNRGKSTSYFRDTEIGFDLWRPAVEQFGIGQRLDVDLPSVGKGNLPSNKFYDKIYGDNRWAFSTIYSLGLGQGEMGVLPIQLANLAAIIANKGYYITPHLINGIGDRRHRLKKYNQKHYVNIKPEYFDFITRAMEAVVQRGTATMARSKNIQICGKTGTAQNPHGKDNSLFIGFAPMVQPKIAICVVLENAGWGATAAAPMASLIIQKYLTGTIENQQREDYVVKGVFIE